MALVRLMALLIAVYFTCQYIFRYGPSHVRASLPVHFRNLLALSNTESIMEAPSWWRAMCLAAPYAVLVIVFSHDLVWIRPRSSKLKLSQILYERHFGIQGRQYDLKVAALQALTVLLQALGKLHLLGGITVFAIQQNSSATWALKTIFWTFWLLLLFNSIYPTVLLMFPTMYWSRCGSALLDVCLDLGYLLTYLLLVVIGMTDLHVETSVSGNFGTSLVTSTNINFRNSTLLKYCSASHSVRSSLLIIFWLVLVVLLLLVVVVFFFVYFLMRGFVLRYARSTIRYKSRVRFSFKSPSILGGLHESRSHLLRLQIVGENCSRSKRRTPAPKSRSLARFGWCFAYEMLPQVSLFTVLGGCTNCIAAFSGCLPWTQRWLCMLPMSLWWWAFEKLWLGRAAATRTAGHWEASRHPPQSFPTFGVPSVTSFPCQQFFGAVEFHVFQTFALLTRAGLGPCQASKLARRHIFGPCKVGSIIAKREWTDPDLGNTP